MTQEVIVHKIYMGDVEDPDLFVAEPIYKWQESEEGKWIMERSVEKPMWKRQTDPSSYGYVYTIHAWLDGKDLTYWKLKYE
jgi:hypothetical protein